MSENRYEVGMKTRRSVLGDAHVDRASANVTEIDAGFQRYITENVWNGVWTSDTFTKRERSIVTIALLAGLGHEEELAMHIRATLNTGATREDIREVLMHVAVYAGVPTANTAFRIAKQTYAEIDNAAAKGE
ncbi:4-carboxymuconolactone decarboxylase [Thalassospira xiamenensis M-5 = DSM 17429]|uniref:Gamma carboxymuconolactone decarboxylase n=1 Tax=Thalassospira xiamenensis M-5 = DSM 17429 TaxID=1123366 RepID=A0AB72UDI1_9PROT|nr:4-carboxymuconolactone decarboxylase [Thalassospira xiamenensis]AJD52330.1 gamma carboxymuconolactone decarboxylase [Thalassospira xiamenensis M-5 = DSM 17429]SIS86913.1 4-carboxymuconolactone decarboxylase [Thalassospira xiamenensis M-5 = DSM 17429]